MKKYRKKIFNIVFLALVFGLTLWSVFRGQDLGALMGYIKLMNPAYLPVCVVCVLCFIMGESVIIYYLFRVLGIRPKLTHCFLYSFIGFFYSAITPSASGGQPMQLVYMRRDKIPVAVSTVVLAIVTITYKMVLVVLGAVIIIFRPAVVIDNIGGTMWIVYLGMFLNVVCIAALLVLVFVPAIVEKLGEKCLALVHRIRPFKNPEKQEKRLKRITTQYAGTAEFFKAHKVVIFNVLLMTCVQRIFLFVITGFTYLSFGLTGGGDFVLVTTLQGMVSVAVDMLPLPGGMGVSENLFLFMFDDIFGPRLTLPAMVVSRGISYYVQLAISGIMTIVAIFVIRDAKKGEKGK